MGVLPWSHLITSALAVSLVSGSFLPRPNAAYSNLNSDPVGVGHAVADLGATVKFYHDLLGLVVLSQDKHWKANPAYGLLTNTTGASYKQAVIAIPNQKWTLVLTEYKGVHSKPIKNREQDPAAPGLTLTVKNATAINNALVAANSSGYTITTVNGGPIPAGSGAGTTSTVGVYDPDNYMVELVQRSNASDYFSVPEPTDVDGPGSKYVIQGQLDLTMFNYTQALTFYRDVLGQNISAGFSYLVGPYEYGTVGYVGTVFGIPTNTPWAAVTGNCDPVTRCEYYEYDDPDRVSLIYPIQDPGVGITYYAVQNLDALVKKVKAAGLPIITAGAKPILVDGVRSIIVRDPAGYLVALEEEEKCRSSDGLSEKHSDP